MKILSKRYTYTHIVTLTATIERDDFLTGYNILGLPIYNKKIEQRVFYGCNKYEANNEMIKYVNRPKYQQSLKYERITRYI
jgi:hypothetical protein